MLPAMSSPENDRRAVPRHLRDGENDLLSATGTFGPRSDARPGRARTWTLALAAVVVAALALGWFLLR